MTTTDDIQFALSDLPLALQLFAAFKAAVASMPAPPHKPSDYMELSSVLLKAAEPLADQIYKQVHP